MAIVPVPRPASESYAWPSPEVLREQAPIFRLLMAIGDVPHVTRIGVTLGQAGVTLWVFMEIEDDAGEAAIADAERAYLNAMWHGSFELRVIPGSAIPQENLPPYEIVFER